MEKREKKETSKATLIAALAVIVIIVGYYAAKILPDTFTPPSYDKNRPSFVYSSYQNIGRTNMPLFSIHDYSKEEVISYFSDVVLKSEFGGTPSIKKWNIPILLFVRGTPSKEDMTTLFYLIGKLNSLSGFPGIQITSDEKKANSYIHFYSGDDYSNWERQQAIGAHGSSGLAVLSKKNDETILETLIGINCDRSQHKRSSVIMEELIQSLGLFNDSWKYSDSIFYQGSKEVDSPKDIDWILTDLLYHPAIRFGASRSECLFILRNILVD